MSELGSDIDGLHPSVSLPLTLRHRIVAVELAGPRFPPVPAPGGNWSPPTNHDRANFVPSPHFCHWRNARRRQRRCAEILLREPASGALPRLSKARDSTVGATAAPAVCGDGLARASNTAPSLAARQPHRESCMLSSSTTCETLTES